MRGFGSMFALLFVLTGAVAAQESGARVYVVPKVGVYTSLSTLAEFDDRSFDLGSSPALGLAIEVTLPGTRFGLRANMEYGTGTEVLSHGRSLSENNNTILVVTGDLVYRIRGDAQVRPYVFGGLGVKHYDFEVPSVGVLNDGATDFTLRPGLGVEINVGFGAVIAELSDYMSWFKPEDRGSTKMQNDIFGMVGIRIGLF